MTTSIGLESPEVFFFFTINNFSFFFSYSSCDNDKRDVETTIVGQGGQITDSGDEDSEWRV
jgi:hypothetical protein